MASCITQTEILQSILFKEYIKYTVYILPAVFVAPSWLAVIPSVVLHSLNSFSSSSPWLSTGSWAGSKDWLGPLSLSLQLEERPPTGEALHWEEVLFVGLMATVFETGGRVVEVGGPPFLPKAACPLPTVLPDLLCSGLNPGPMVELLEPTGGWGFQSGGGPDDGAFFPMGVRTGIGGGDETGAAGEGWGEAGRSWGIPGMKFGASLSGDAGGVWKLSPGAPEEEKQLHLYMK